MTRNTRTAAERKNRREYLGLLLVSGVFTAIGVAMWISTGQLLGLICAIFFGACFLTGATKLLNAPPAVEQLLMAVACVGFAATCAAMIFAGASPYIAAGLDVLIVGLVGFTFFGGGSVLLLVHLVRRKVQGR
ncbi:MAG TPA: hypothetical protein H9902_06505 [Candidatus Stackebrandtia faecavium]|nr:hypothetical protein [Candidatus Stackebrandtia faecavium]